MRCHLVYFPTALRKYACVEQRRRHCRIDFKGLAVVYQRLRMHVCEILKHIAQLGVRVPWNRYRAVPLQVQAEREYQHATEGALVPLVRRQVASSVRTVWTRRAGVVRFTVAR